jgi:hypothetical protein
VWLVAPFPSPTDGVTDYANADGRKTGQRWRERRANDGRPSYATNRSTRRTEVDVREKQDLDGWAAAVQARPWSGREAVAKGAEA